MRVRVHMSLRARFLRLTVCAILIAASIVPLFMPGNAFAAQITARRLVLEDNGATNGASKPGAFVKHHFYFTLPSNTSVGSILFKYCTTAAGTCTMPTGMDSDTTSTLTDEQGATGFSLVRTTNGAPYLTRTAAVSTGAVSYQFTGIKNPTATNTSFFVRISTYSSTDTTGSPIDTGVVTASTATQIVLTGIMPESLIFCTGAEITINGSNIPDCATATSGAIDFNQLFSPTDTATATSQMAASTNATSGYSITVNGPTLTNGGNTITAMNVAGASVRGTSQFGMNLVDNATPDVGGPIAPASNGTDLRAIAASGYDTADQFKFESGNTVATSNSTGTGAAPTNSQRYIVTYIVNVPGSQTAGTYTTTLTYVCTALF